MSFIQVERGAILIAFTVCVFFCFLFLGEMAFTVSHDPPHVVNVILVVFSRVLLGILLQNFDNFPATDAWSSIGRSNWEILIFFTSRVRLFPQSLKNVSLTTITRLQQYRTHHPCSIQSRWIPHYPTSPSIHRVTC